MASSPMEKIDTSLPASGQLNRHWPEDLQPDGVCSEPGVYTKLNKCNFTKRCRQIIDHLTYLALTLVGVYFIIEGKVIPHFQSGKTKEVSEKSKIETLDEQNQPKSQNETKVLGSGSD